MVKVTGLGGIFFKCENPEMIQEWYEKNLGIPSNEYGTTFLWRDEKNPETVGSTVWAPFKEETTYFAPSEKEFMINYRVENLDLLLNQLKGNGVEIVGEIDQQPYGRFAHIMDPEGNKIELWEPHDEE